MALAAPLQLACRRGAPLTRATRGSQLDLLQKSKGPRTGLCILTITKPDAEQRAALKAGRMKRKAQASTPAAAATAGAEANAPGVAIAVGGVDIAAATAKDRPAATAKEETAADKTGDNPAGAQSK